MNFIELYKLCSAIELSIEFLQSRKTLHGTRYCECEHEMKLIFRIAKIDGDVVKKNAENKNN